MGTLPGSGPGPGPVPELLVPLVQACPAVVALHGGPFGEVATYLPGRRVRGVRVTEEEVDIHVVGRYPATVTEIATQVRAALADHIGDRALHIRVEDLAVPGDPVPDDAIVDDPPARPQRAPHADETEPGSRSGSPEFPPPGRPDPAGRPDSAAADSPAT